MRKRGGNVLTMIAFMGTKRLGCFVLCWAFHAFWQIFSRASVHGAIPNPFDPVFPRQRTWRTVSGPCTTVRVSLPDPVRTKQKRRTGSCAKAPVHGRFFSRQLLSALPFSSYSSSSSQPAGDQLASLGAPETSSFIPFGFPTSHGRLDLPPRVPNNLPIVVPAIIPPTSPTYSPSPPIFSLSAPEFSMSYY